MLRQDLSRLTDVLSALIDPTDSTALDGAVQTLMNSGDGRVVFDSAAHEAVVKFDPDKLREGLQYAIDRYNNDVVHKKI